MREPRRPLFGRCTCCPSDMGRREFVAGGIAALGIGAFAAAGRKAAEQAKPHRMTCTIMFRRLPGSTR